MRGSSSRVVVALALAACSWPAPSKVVPKDVSAQPAPAAAARPDAGHPSVALPAGFDELSAEARNSMQALHQWLSANAAQGWEGWQVIPDGPQREVRLAWLAKDFGAATFRSAQRLDEAVLQGHAQTSPLHVGLIVVGFANCRQLAEARAHISKVGRTNFALPVLTEFRTRAHGHQLIFVLSETSQLTEVEHLFGGLDAVLGADSICSD